MPRSFWRSRGYEADVPIRRGDDNLALDLETLIGVKTNAGYSSERLTKADLPTAPISQVPSCSRASLMCSRTGAVANDACAQRRGASSVEVSGLEPPTSTLRICSDGTLRPGCCAFTASHLVQNSEAIRNQ